jgi:hypothetical protein
VSGKTIFTSDPILYTCDLKCKRCGGRVIEDEIYYENNKAWIDLCCLLCCEHFYLTRGEWETQKKKIVELLDKRKRDHEQDPLKDRQE